MIWDGTLRAFRDRVAGTDPVPAGVSVSAVTATLGLGLLIKAVEIASKRKDFAGDPQQARSLVEAAALESARLVQAADDDIAAFKRYLADAATREVIEVPRVAARAAVAGLDLCVEAAGMVHAAVAADLGAGAALLTGAAYAILLSVYSNVRQLGSDDPYYIQVVTERKQLEERAFRQGQEVVRKLFP